MNDASTDLRPPSAAPGSGDHHVIAYRADIDGLRAIAVLAVVFNHIGLRGFLGGYVGVDIFFVISGYLITGIIWKELRNGSFTIAARFSILSPITSSAWSGCSCRVQLMGCSWSAEISRGCTTRRLKATEDRSICAYPGCLDRVWRRCLGFVGVVQNVRLTLGERSATDAA